LTCSKNKHQEGGICTATPVCINCNGSHVTVDKKCPKTIESHEMQLIMTYDNTPFALGSKHFYGQKQKCSTKVRIKNLCNFSMLNRSLKVNKTFYIN
jgi:hypothetical protein